MKLPLLLILSVAGFGQTTNVGILPVSQTPKAPSKAAATTSTGGICVDAGTGCVVKLSDEEYARLQKLRRAVDFAETEIARVHGVDLWGVCKNTQEWCWKLGRPDHYEFRGQYLLINVP